MPPHVREQVHGSPPSLIMDLVLAARESNVKEAQVALEECCVTFSP